jgi:hypothetical protein
VVHLLDKPFDSIGEHSLARRIRLRAMEVRATRNIHPYDVIFETERSGRTQRQKRLGDSPQGVFYGIERDHPNAQVGTSRTGRRYRLPASQTERVSLWANLIEPCVTQERALVFDRSVGPCEHEREWASLVTGRCPCKLDP